MSLFRRKEVEGVDPVEERFYTCINLIKDLSTSDFKRYREMEETLYNAISKSRKVKTNTEREAEEIEKQEKEIAKEVLQQWQEQ